MKKEIKIIATLAVIIFLAWFIKNNSEILTELKNINPYYLIPLLIIAISQIYINGLFLKVTLIPFNVKLKEVFSLSALSSFYNTITPFRGGTGYRAYYLKNNYKLPFKGFISILFGSYIIIMVTNAIFALLTFILLYLEKNLINLPITFLFILIFITNLYLILRPPTLKNPQKSFFIKLNQILKGWEILTKNKKIIPYLIFLTLISNFNQILMNGIALNSLNFNISTIELIFLTLLPQLGAYINITPGSLGITESLYVFSGLILNIPIEMTLALSLVIRTVNTLVNIFLGLFCNLFLIKSPLKVPNKKHSL